MLDFRLTQNVEQDVQIPCHIHTKVLHVFSFFILKLGFGYIACGKNIPTVNLYLLF